MLNLFASWTLTTTLAGAVLYPVFLLVGAQAVSQFGVEPLRGWTLVGAPLAGAVAGGLAGLGQWRALRGRVPQAWAWPLVCILSWALGATVALATFAWLLPEGLGYSALITPFVVGGALAGAVQTPLLRHWVSGTGWWVLASAIGWGLGWVVSLALAGGLSFGELPPGLGVVVLGGVHGLVIGLESGLALVYLLLNFPQESLA